jgi:hypothetical protein
MSNLNRKQLLVCFLLIGALMGQLALGTENSGVTTNKWVDYFTFDGVNPMDWVLALTGKRPVCFGAMRTRSDVLVGRGLVWPWLALHGLSPTHDVA